MKLCPICRGDVEAVGSFTMCNCTVASLRIVAVSFRAKMDEANSRHHDALERIEELEQEKKDAPTCCECGTRLYGDDEHGALQRRIANLVALLRRVRPAWDDDRVEICDEIDAAIDGNVEPPRFYLLSLKHTKGGDGHLTWWRPASRGYCWSLTHAGLYDEAEAKQIEQGSTFEGARSCVAVPEAVAKALSYAVVENNGENLEKLGTSHAEWRKAGRS